MSGCSDATSSWRAEADVHVPDAVVVELDRELRLLHSQDVQEPLLAVEGLDRRQRLLHAPEHDPPVLALEPHRNEARAGLELDLLERERRAEDERGAERRVPGERHLDRRREDPDPRVPVALRLVDEHGLGEVHLPRDRLQLVLGDLARVREDGDLVALQRRVREDVCDDVAEARHALTLREEGGQGAERLRDDAKVRPAATLLTLDEPRLTKDLEMVAHGRLREAERSGQVADAGLSARLSSGSVRVAEAATDLRAPSARPRAARPRPPRAHPRGEAEGTWRRWSRSSPSPRY